MSEPKNEDTNQYLRGKVLARLRAEANPRGLPLPALARLLRESATDVEPVRLMAVVESLERDGLVSVTPVSERSAGQPAGVVAEGERPTWPERNGKTLARSGSPYRRTALPPEAGRYDARTCRRPHWTSAYSLCSGLAALERREQVDVVVAPSGSATTA